MELLFVVQRYGREVAGGAEQFCREYATRLVGRGHGVEVVTSCAVSYVDWANAFPAGDEIIDKVLVHRLPVERPRDNDLFGPLNGRVVGGHKPVPLHLQREWMRLQGPFFPELPEWLANEARRFDAIVFFTYLYYTTFAGLPVAADLRPCVLHPNAHDEPPLYLPLFDTVFHLPHAFGFLTEEEGDLVRRRFQPRRRSTTLGIGVDLEATGNGDAFRAAYGLGEDPYLVYVGRLDPHKGVDELYDFFVTYKRRNPGPLRLVCVGEPVKPMTPHPDVVVTGFVDGPTRLDAVDGALAFVMPSYFESFSMVLSEAWAQRRPALVQRACAVLAGQARRSGGAIPYRGFAEFEAAVDLLSEDRFVGTLLGEAGRRYVESRYEWDAVLTHYERFLDELVG